MKGRLSRKISTKFAFVVIVIVSISVTFFVARRALNIIEEIEQKTLQTQKIENQILEDIKAR